MMKWVRRYLNLLLCAALASACSLAAPPAPVGLPAPGGAAPTGTPFQPAAQTPGATASVPSVEALQPTPGTRSAAPGTRSAAPGARDGRYIQALPAVQNAVVSALSGQAGIPLWVDPSLPTALRAALRPPPELSLLAASSASGAPATGAPATGAPATGAPQAALRLTVASQAPLARWVYALVAPFPSLEQGVTSADLLRAWSGERGGPFGGQPLWMSADTAALFGAWWGAPAQGGIEILPGDTLLQKAWKQRRAWALLPFEDLDPRWKVLQVDGISPLHKDFDLQAYALSLPVGLQGDPVLVGALSSLYGAQSAAPLLPASNRDPAHLTVLAMSGVTALVRATAYTMERRGVLYPGKDVRDWLRSADLTHISNEVPFAKDCPFPDPVQQGMRFCSDPRYIQLLEDVGTDIVELTGDHFQDWGSQAMLYTLELYRQRGWLYYGGGADLEEARRAITVEHNGNRLAFIGCNAKGGGFAQAGPKHPGAVKCDLDWMAGEISRLRSEGYLPIATFQHFEYYTYQAQPNQERDSRLLANAGALIVSGSQAHQPQALEFVGQSLIHYGLGNLFFDQYDVSQAARQAFIDLHVFYEGRYIGSELLPIVFVDYARPRPMTASERSRLLRAVFSASGW